VLGGHLASRADAGQAGADDQDVEMLCVHGFLGAFACCDRRTLYKQTG
jgi:hypothetical protein